jgi:hypothetical protein
LRVGGGAGHQGVASGAVEAEQRAGEGHRRLLVGLAVLAP